MSAAPDSTPTDPSVTSDAGNRWSTRKIANRIGASRQRLPGSAAGQLWRRLRALDVLTRAMVVAAVLLLSFIPFTIVVESLAGRSFATTVIHRFGLNAQAAGEVSRVFTSPTATSGTLTSLGYVFFVLSGFATAAAVQDLYEHAFGLPGRGLRDTPPRLAWLVLVIAAGALGGWAGPGLQSLGGPVLSAAAGLIGFTVFWWLSMWLLLGGRMDWWALFPAGLATGICWLGMTIFFRLTMSATIVSNSDKYGPFGIVFAIMSALIAVGVVIILGAVAGAVWQERRTPRDGAVREPRARQDFGHRGGHGGADREDDIGPPSAPRDHRETRSSAGFRAVTTLVEWPRRAWTCRPREQCNRRATSSSTCEMPTSMHTAASQARSMSQSTTYGWIAFRPARF